MRTAAQNSNFPVKSDPLFHRIITSWIIIGIEAKLDCATHGFTYALNVYFVLWHH